MAQDIPGYLVVGVDGSSHAEVAVRAALRQAQVTGGVVHALLAWEYPSIFATPEVRPGDEDLTFEMQAQKRLDEALAPIVAEFPAVKVIARAVQGSATQVLLDAAEGADLLVVGSRGYGGFRGIMLGSVSQHVAQYAPCSVLIVR